ncbi:MAG: phosphodiester glycosidase family protein [Armatimonadetes bacterium]|nr:phosphodiester glycosidase family protein [Armatimonadota bacterium]
MAQTPVTLHTRSGAVGLRLLIAAGLAAAVAFCCTGTLKSVDSRHIEVVEVAPAAGVEVRPALTAAGVGGTERFSRMLDRLKPFAAINGTYYDEHNKPLGDILIDGKLVNRGRLRNAIAITEAGRVRFIRRSKGGFNWSGYHSGLAAGPMLVHSGKIALDPVADGFTRRSLSIRAWRSGVGVTKNDKLLMVTAKESLTLAEFAEIMRKLGAVEAMNLDGGGACALYHRGKTLAHPTLPMTNLLMVYEK